MAGLNPELHALIDPGCQRAIDVAVHAADPDRFHRRFSGGCPLCLTLGERIAEAFRSNVPGTALSERAKESIRRMMELQDQRFEADE